MLDPTGSATRPSLSDSDALPVTAVVLAGGRSRRMGTDKALLSVGGELLVTRVVRTLAAVCTQVIIVASDTQALVDIDLPDTVRVIADDVAFQGPLRGLATALAAADTPWVFAAGVDMPFLNAQIVRILWEERAAAESRCPGRHVQVVMPVGVAGPEPLLSLYRADCLSTALRVLAEGSRRIVDLCSRLDVVTVPLERLTSVDPELLSIFNVNTAEDLARARSAAQTLELSARRPDTEGTSGR